MNEDEAKESMKTAEKHEKMKSGTIGEGKQRLLNKLKRVKRLKSHRTPFNSREEREEDRTQSSLKKVAKPNEPDIDVESARELQKIEQQPQLPVSGTGSASTESTDVVRKDDPPKKTREHFSSTITYLLTTIGCAVGLGNVWRFPAEAAENGGIVFMIPYFVCTFFVGIPILYFESFIGQFTQKGNGKCFFLYMPAAAGLGIAQYILVFLLAAFYYVITGWSCIYLMFILLEDHQRWTRCDNAWNTPNCRSAINDRECPTGAHFVKGLNCIWNKTLDSAGPIVYPSQELLINYVWDSSDGPFTLGLNNKMIVIMAFLWLIAYLVAWKGVKVMGYVSYFTTIAPYVVVMILCLFGFTREGFADGIAFFIFKADFTKLYQPKVWGAAFAQMCLSLSLGYGAHPTLGSFNPIGHNSLRDAFLIIAADTVMSLSGGIAMFSILGNFAHQKGKSVGDLMQENLGAGPMLAFVVYPEAVSSATGGWLWTLLFFLMLFLLGFSTIIVATKILATAFTDAFPVLEKRAHWIQFGVVIALYITGLPIMSKSAGGWVDIYDFSVSSFAIFIIIFCEIIVCFHCYGIRRFRDDLRKVFGKPRWWSWLCGFSGYYFLFSWLIVVPLVTLAMTGFMIYSKIDGLIKEASAGNQPPVYAEVIRWFLLCFILACIPLMAILQMILLRRQTKSWKSAFRPHPLHPTFGIHPPTASNVSQKKTDASSTKQKVTFVQSHDQGLSKATASTQTLPETPKLTTGNSSKTKTDVNGSSIGRTPRRRSRSSKEKAQSSKGSEERH